MTTRTILENAAAASFAFIASAIVCGAVLVASMSAAPAQTFTLPGVGTSNGNAGGNAWGQRTTDGSFTGPRESANTTSPTSANVSGVPGHSTPSTLNATSGFKK